MEMGDALKQAKFLINSGKDEEARIALREIIRDSPWHAPAAARLLIPLLPEDEQRFVRTLKERGVREGEAVIAANALRVMKANSSQAGSIDVEQVADGVVGAMTHRLPAVKNKKENALLSKAASVVKQLQSKIVNSELLELLVYLGTYTLHMAGASEDSEERARRIREERIKGKLLTGLAYEDKKAFEDNINLLRGRLLFKLGDEVLEEIAQSPIAVFIDHMLAAGKKSGIQYSAGFKEFTLIGVRNELIWSLIREAQKRL
jgi:hypothetical protein